MSVWLSLGGEVLASVGERALDGRGALAKAEASPASFSRQANTPPRSPRTGPYCGIGPMLTHYGPMSTTNTILRKEMIANRTEVPECDQAPATAGLDGPANITINQLKHILSGISNWIIIR